MDLTAHPQYAGFLTAIRADPENDALRLIVADWFEERGEADRAEFVRASVELGLTYWQDGSFKCDVLLREPYATLCRRCRDLLTMHAWGWASEAVRAAFPAGTDYAKAITYRRGFIESMTLTASAWIAHADDILAAHPLQTVTLTTWPLVWDVDPLPHSTEAAQRLLAKMFPAVKFNLPDLDTIMPRGYYQPTHHLTR